MEVFEFLSEDTYILLPTKSNPKVYLNISTKEKAKLAFLLYNPFSKKGKILKRITAFLCVYYNSIAKVILPTIQGEKSPFLVFLEEKLNAKLTSSVYIATAKDKIVLQLQNDNGIVGYLKYPISNLGEKRLINEQKGISSLAQKNIVPGLILCETFKKTPFFVLQNIEGEINDVDAIEYNVVLNAFKKDKKFMLVNHPRIFSLKSRLKSLDLEGLYNKLEHIAKASEKKYYEVFEHGDFAPWNLIKTKSGLVPFDLEYSEESGLEHLDVLKYHFQKQHLLYNKSGNILITAIDKATNILEFDLIFQIFLIKEIILKAEDNESFNLESSLLKTMNPIKQNH